MMTTKDSRLNTRLTADQDAIIRRAAEIEGQTVSEFAAGAIFRHARDVLADQHAFFLDAAGWTEFNAILDRPVRDNPQLAKLLSRKPQWS